MEASNESDFSYSYTDHQVEQSTPVASSSSNILAFSKPFDEQEVLQPVASNNDYEMYTVDVNNLKVEEKSVQQLSMDVLPSANETSIPVNYDQSYAVLTSYESQNADDISFAFLLAGFIFTILSIFSNFFLILSVVINVLNYRLYYTPTLSKKHVTYATYSFYLLLLDFFYIAMNLTIMLLGFFGVLVLSIVAEAL